MKRIKFILLAIAMLLAAPAFLTSCQEDAPEINYTMNVSVINDFAKVVEAINNGSLKNEQAIQKLTEAIDKMNADQQTKLQAITDVLNSVNATLETKLAETRHRHRQPQQQYGGEDRSHHSGYQLAEHCAPEQARPHRGGDEGADAYP